MLNRKADIDLILIFGFMINSIYKKISCDILLKYDWQKYVLDLFWHYEYIKDVATFWQQKISKPE
jgi:hypothetical protein